MGINQDLQVKSKLFNQDARKNIPQYLSLKKLKPGLRIMAGQVKQKPHHQIIPQADNSTLKRIIYHRIRVHFRADYNICVIQAHDIEQCLNL